MVGKRRKSLFASVFRGGSEKLLFCGSLIAKKYILKLYETSLEAFVGCS